MLHPVLGRPELVQQAGVVLISARLSPQSTSVPLGLMSPGGSQSSPEAYLPPAGSLEEVERSQSQVRRRSLVLAVRRRAVLTSRRHRLLSLSLGTQVMFLFHSLLLFPQWIHLVSRQSLQH